MKLDRDARDVLLKGIDKVDLLLAHGGYREDSSARHQLAIVRSQLRALLADIERQMVPEGKELLGAIARGWCHPLNEKKEFDSDLAIAIAAEVNALLVAPSAPSSSATDRSAASGTIDDPMPDAESIYQAFFGENDG